jgi:hypothetical protein
MFRVARGVPAGLRTLFRRERVEIALAGIYGLVSFTVAHTSIDTMVALRCE